MKTKILFTSPLIMHPAASGPLLRIENSIKALSKMSELHVISQVPSHVLGKQRAIRFYQNLSHAFLFSSKVNRLSSLRHIRAAQILTKKLYANDAKFIINYANKHQIKLIWFGYGNLSYPLICEVKKRAPHLRLICDTDSVWSRFIFRELPFVHDEIERKRILKETAQKEQEERHWVELCDITTGVSQVDADYYRTLTENKQKIAVFSNVLDLENYPEIVAPPNIHHTPSIYLAGSFGKEGSAMNRAATWLLLEILPLVRKAIPNVHCYIVGNHSDVAFGSMRSSHITVTGKLESVLPYLKNTDVALTPLQFESGTRFKILEAGACKIPMVSTTLGAEGIPVKHDEHLLIADTTEDFAKAIVKLIRDKAHSARLAENCFKLVQHSYSLDQLKREADEILARIA